MLLWRNIICSSVVACFYHCYRTIHADDADDNVSTKVENSDTSNKSWKQLWHRQESVYETVLKVLSRWTLSEQVCEHEWWTEVKSDSGEQTKYIVQCTVNVWCGQCMGMYNETVQYVQCVTVYSVTVCETVYSTYCAVTRMEVAQMTTYRGHGYRRVEHVSVVILLDWHVPRYRSPRSSMR